MQVAAEGSGVCPAPTAGADAQAGAALAAKQRGGDDAGIVFFGDGAANEGIFHEALNLAAIWRLPAVFLCENDQYGLSTASGAVTAGGSAAGTVVVADPGADREKVRAAFAPSRTGRPFWATAATRWTRTARPAMALRSRR